MQVTTKKKTGETINQKTDKDFVTNSLAIHGGGVIIQFLSLIKQREKNGDIIGKNKEEGAGSGKKMMNEI